MRRGPLVIGATIAGLAGVLTFHTRSTSLTLGSLPRISSTRVSTPSSVTSAPPTSGSTTTPVPSTSATSPAATPTSTTPPATTTPPTTRTAVGATANYNYGTMAVSVTASGTRITNVGIASLDDGGSFRSQSIDQQSIPILEHQVLQAQSANIQGVSGASYTSAGFQRSLQSALGKLGL